MSSIRFSFFLITLVISFSNASQAFEQLVSPSGTFDTCHLNKLKDQEDYANSLLRAHKQNGLDFPDTNLLGFNFYDENFESQNMMIYLEGFIRVKKDIKLRVPEKPIAAIEVKDENALAYLCITTEHISKKMTIEVRFFDGAMLDKLTLLNFYQALLLSLTGNKIEISEMPITIGALSSLEQRFHRLLKYIGPFFPMLYVAKFGVSVAYRKISEGITDLSGESFSRIIINECGVYLYFQDPNSEDVAFILRSHIESEILESDQELAAICKQRNQATINTSL
jgi:hypothetical protein